MTADIFLGGNSPLLSDPAELHNHWGLEAMC